MSRPSTRPVRLGKHRAWLKIYGRETRRFRLLALDWFARRLGIPALRAAPRRAGDAARETEQRRLIELAAAELRVPRVLSSGEGLLLLSDLGDTLAKQIRGADPEQAAHLLARASEALVQVHRNAQYLGQPVSRNILLDPAGRIGFIDFEEDPGAVMDLADAQTRDWLLFASGTARHAGLPPDRYAALIAPALRSQSPRLRDSLGDAVERLGFLRLARYLGARAAGLHQALAGLQRALQLPCWVALGLGLLMGLGHVDDALEWSLLHLLIDTLF